MKTKTLVTALVVLLILIGLFVWGKKNQNSAITFWNDTGVLCLANGHANLAQHIHADIGVTVDGDEVSVPANIGITSTCMAEIHTHSASGEVHIETVEANKEFGIQDFFVVWGEDFEREGYGRTIAVNGEEVDPASYIMKDHDEVVISYVSLGESGIGEVADTLE